MNKHTISTLGSIRIALTSIIHWQSTAAERARIPHPQPLGDAVLVELVGARARHHAQLFPVLELLQADATAAGTAAVVSTSGDKLNLCFSSWPATAAADAGKTAPPKPRLP